MEDKVTAARKAWQGNKPEAAAKKKASAQAVAPSTDAAQTLCSSPELLDTTNSDKAQRAAELEEEEEVRWAALGEDKGVTVGFSSLVDFLELSRREEPKVLPTNSQHLR